MAGSMAADDPEGLHYFETTLAHANGDHDVHLLTDADGVSHREVNAFQRAADVVVQKSTREGFGLVVSEGMWKGKPVVAGDVGGIRLQVESGVTGFLVGTAEGCGACVAELLRDEELARRMGEAGRARVRERFLSTRELEDIVGLLASLDR
jgi:trehalose synthase